MAPPTIATREDLIHVLSEAAELEHGIICQYLFAAFSLKSHIAEGQVTWPQLERLREWKSAILLMARQEMEHLGLVCNLLTAIGGTSHFRRPSFPHTTDYFPPHPTFELQRFCEATIKRFACFEQFHQLPDRNREHAPSGETIGTLYQRIKQGFETVRATLTRDQSGVLFIGDSEAQIGNQHLGLPQGHFDINLLTVDDLSSALRAIDQIIEAGATTASQGHVSHAERFEQMLAEFERLRQHQPDFEPARPVAPNPVTQSPGGPSAEVSLVTHPVTRQAAELFNTAYTTMVLMLTRFYAPADDTPDELKGLMKTAFFPMMTAVIRPLGELLTHMPIHEHDAAPTAGPSFEFRHDLPLSPFRRSAWTLLYERLQAMATSCGFLCLQIERLSAPWAVQLHPRFVFLQENLAGMAHNFERYMYLRREYAAFLLRRLV